MNFRTTLILGLGVILVGALYLVWQVRRVPVESSDGTVVAALPESRQDERSLAAPITDSDNVVRVEYTRRGRDRMVFEKTSEPGGGQAARWQMTEPIRCPATEWMISNVILAIKRLKYDMRYDLKTGSVTLEQVGIEPVPLAVFSVTTDAGESLAVRLGDTQMGRNHVYLPSRPDELFLAEGDFGNILERELTQFRDRQMSPLNPNEVVELEIVQRENGDAVRYHLTKSQGQWMFTSPFQARADAQKIDEVINNLNRLWVRNWLEEPQENLTSFGLADPYLTIRVVTERKVAPPAAASGDDADNDNDNSSSPSEQAVRHEQTIHLSGRKPIDDDSQVYAMRAGENQVGMINAPELSKFVPTAGQWRDMSLTSEPPAEVTKLVMTVGGGTFSLHRDESNWLFSDSQAPAESAAVSDLVGRLLALKAVNFVEAGSAGDAGLSPPRARVTLVLAEHEKEVTFNIGDFTEQSEKRLRYLQVEGSTAVAKVAAKDVEKVFEGRRGLANRDILAVGAGRLMKIEITRPMLTGRGDEFVVLERDENRIWRMTMPTEAEVDLAPVNELADKLGNLRAVSVLEEPNPAKLGLAQPAIQVVVTVEGVPTITADGSEDAGPPNSSGSELYQLAFSQKDGKTYVRRLDRSDCYETESGVFDALAAEFLPGGFWKFEPSEVIEFGSTSDGRTVGFKKHLDRWQYSADPDIPVDSERITHHLTQLKNMTTVHYVNYHASHLGEYGLASPAHRLRIDMKGGAVHELLISDKTLKWKGGDYHFGVVNHSDRVFLVSPASLKIGVIQLDRFEPKDSSQPAS